uniref:Uncharacterized protein n=1 Tax=Steinernema glaseri TaxID=37863 RepID=A0A1I7YX54_9BILA
MNTYSPLLVRIFLKTNKVRGTQFFKIVSSKEASRNYTEQRPSPRRVSWIMRLREEDYSNCSQYHRLPLPARF